MSEIKAVLFDFGGVFTASPFAAMEQVAKELAVDPQVFSELIFGPYHLDTDHPWHRLERGEIALEVCEEALRAGGEKQGITVDLWEVLGKMAEAASNGVFVHEEVVQLLRDVKESGYQTAIVTNNVKEFQGWQDFIPIDQVDVVVDSAFVGMRKPNPKIYEVAIQRLAEQQNVSLQPHECVFLDDVASNVESAQSLGIKGIVVGAEPKETIRSLTEVLGL